MKVKLTYLFLAISAFNHADADFKGCNLKVPKAVEEQIEPEPQTLPLIIHVHLLVIRVRDVPDSGGSYGVDVV